jgi:MFS family permease
MPQLPAPSSRLPTPDTPPYLPPVLRASLQSIFAALRHRNFRLFLTGQFISLCGTWMQTIAQGWLVLQLTNSAFAVGLVTALGSLPILLFSLYGGVIADRVNKRRFILLLQSLMLAEALTLAILTALHLITVQWVMGLAVFSGLLTAFEVPTRQAFVAEIVEREDLMNAIALGSSAFNLARVIGPALAGALIATAGLAACFFANAASYLAVIASLLRMEVKGSRASAAAPLWTALREGFSYVFGHRWPRALIIIVATFSIFGFSFVPLMPVFARDALGLDASGYGAMVASIGIGAVGAAFFMAAFGDRVRQSRLVLGSSTLFGAVLFAASLAPEFWSAVALFTATGGVMALNGIAANTMLQSEAPNELRGRIMGFYSFMVLGLAPFGSLQAGWLAEHFGVRVAFGLGGVVCLLVVVGVAWHMGKRRREARQRWREGREREGRETREGREGREGGEERGSREEAAS